MTMKDNKKTEAEKRGDSLQELIDILWDYISENDIPEISRRLEETEKGE